METGEPLKKKYAKPLKTHCRRGHQFISSNLVVNKTNGSRTCRQCTRDRLKQRLLADKVKERKERECLAYL